MKNENAFNHLLWQNYKKNTQLYTLMHQSHKIKAAPKFKLRCGFYLSIFNSYYLYHNFII